MEYLSLKEIVFLKKDINHELDLLLSNKVAVTKPHSLQWLFFVDCVNTLFIPQTNSKFNSLTNSNKAQFKYEIENKLRNFYLRPGRKINFVFQMIHKKELKNIFYDEADSYPDIGEYAVLVRDTSKEISPNNGLTEKDIKEYIERVVTEAVDTEFEAYQTLPKIIEEELLNSWFCPFGPAKKEIMHVLTRHVERGWVLTNPMNPSTKRILSIKVKDVKKKEIYVSTTEYWYLRCWDTKKNSYAFPYRETNHQQYILRPASPSASDCSTSDGSQGGKDTGIWKVYETIRPSPRTSIPHRRKYL